MTKTAISGLENGHKPKTTALRSHPISLSYRLWFSQSNRYFMHGKNCDYEHEFKTPSDLVYINK